MRSDIEKFLAEPPRFLFFTGKGGVGKTSFSSATAVALADRGKKALLVSTDPASNLDQVLGCRLSGSPTPIAEATALFAMNINPRDAAARYREKVVGPYRGVLPEAAVTEIEEQLSGACTVEIAAFDEFSRLMTDDTTLREFDHIIFDTAPTGHTLRLLQLPAAWKGYLETSSGNASCLGPMSGLGSQREQFAAALAVLSDAGQTRLVLVARPDGHSISEAHRTSQELAKLGIVNQHLALNGLLHVEQSADATAAAMNLRQEAALQGMPADLQRLPSVRIPLSLTAPLGISSLRSLLQNRPSADLRLDMAEPEFWTAQKGKTFDRLVDSLGIKPGVIMTMGKGGVGKTTLASRFAMALAERGARVHLTTSDPAAHLDLTLSEKHPNLRVSRIDPVVETERYRQDVLNQADSHLDEEGRRLLAEDLLSPCTEEIAVFRAFAKVVDEARDRVVVIDTAPTGHTILLLDATEAYHRDVSRNRSSIPDDVRQLLPRLRDPAFTRVMIVALPEATPVQEAMALQEDLRRAGISPYAWIINQSLAPLAISHPVLQAKRVAEFQYIQQVMEISSRLAIAPWQTTNDKEAI